MDSAGKAILFLLPTELPYLKELEGHGLRMVETTPSTILASLVGEHAAVHAGGSLSAKGKEAASALQVGFEQQVVQQMVLREMATSAFRSFIRAYATYPLALKQIFHVKLLHLGHIAKSFALRETPADMGAFQCAHLIELLQSLLLYRQRQRQRERECVCVCVCV